MSDSADTAPRLSYGRLSLLLAGALVLVVVLMNLLSPEEIPISEEGLLALIEDDVVQTIVIGDGWLVCELTREVAVEEQTGVGTRPRRGRRVSVNLRESPSAEQRRLWRDAGVAIEDADEDALAQRSRQQQTGWVVMGVLLSIGVYYVVSQARRSKRHDSPRARLAQLEQALKRGDISREDYDRKVEEISVEL